MFEFKELCGGPNWRCIRKGFVRLSQAHAFALVWLREHDYSIIDMERDNENQAYDIMTVKGKDLYQFAIETIKEKRLGLV